MFKNDLETSAIFHTNGRKIFGALLSSLCEKANISYRELGRRSETYRRYLMDNGHVQHAYSTGGLDHSAIVRAAKGEKPLTYSQVFIWLHLLREEVHFSKELETDMFRLALCGTPEEVIFAYNKHKHMLKKDRDTEELPAIRRTVKLKKESTQC